MPLCNAGITGNCSWGIHFDLITGFSGNQLPDYCSRNSFGRARKKSTNPQFWIRIFSGHMKGWGPKSSVCPSKAGKSNFLAGYPGILLGYPGGTPQKKVWEKKKFVFNSCPYLVICVAISNLSFRGFRGSRGFQSFLLTTPFPNYPLLALWVM